MKKLVAFIVTTADGFYAGPADEFDWPVIDDEFDAFSVEQLGEVDTLVFGRVTYLGMESHWSTSDDTLIAPIMNSIAKVVVSGTLPSAEWQNTRLVRSLNDVAELKSGSGKDIAVFGSSALTAGLLDAGLLDEVRIMLHPVALGQGKSLFRTASSRIGLELTDVRRFKSGNVLLTYRPA